MKLFKYLLCIFLGLLFIISIKAQPQVELTTLNKSSSYFRVEKSENKHIDPEHDQIQDELIKKNAEVLFVDEENHCKIFRSFFTEYGDDVLKVKNNIKSGTFYEVDDLNNTFVTNENFKSGDLDFTEIVTYKAGNKHIKLISLVVPKNKLEEYKPMYINMISRFLN